MRILTTETLKERKIMLTKKQKTKESEKSQKDMLASASSSADENTLAVEAAANDDLARVLAYVFEHTDDRKMKLYIARSLGMNFE